MIDSKNPATMSRNIMDLKKSGGGGSGSGLPDIGPEDYGSFLAVDENGEWGLDRPESGYNISDVEIETGIKIAGSPLYAKRYPYAGTSQGTVITNDNIFPVFALIYRKGSTGSNNGCAPIHVYRAWDSQSITLGESLPATMPGSSDTHYIIYYLK